MKKLKNLIIAVLVVLFCACDATKNSVSEKQFSFDKVEEISFKSALFENMEAPQTRVVFNQNVDLRYAWLGNDAQQVDFETRILKLINSATTRIDVATQALTNLKISQALADKANAGVQVRIITDRTQRTAQGVWKSQAANVSMIDNNLPAMMYRINFQKGTDAPPEGWVADRGGIYSNHGDMNYGWAVSQAPYVISSGVFPSPLLDDSFSRANADGAQTWEIEVPSGYYYIHAMVGNPFEQVHPKTYLLAEGQSIFKKASGYTPFLETNTREDHSDLFNGSLVYGGYNSDKKRYHARRILVTDGRLTITLGNGKADSISSLCYLEIYKGDGDAGGDDDYDDAVNKTIQDDQSHHANYIIVDGATPSATLWTGSSGLVEAMDTISSDAIISKSPDLCAVFLNQFNQKWGNSSSVPDPAHANFGPYKTATPDLDLSIDGFDWAVRFSPSINGTCDMGAVVNNMVGGAKKDLVLMLENFDDSDAGRGVVSSGAILSKTLPELLSLPEFDLFAMVGSDRFYSVLDVSSANAHIARSGSQNPFLTHNKYALSDVLKDSRRTLGGKVLCGSMNWSRSDLHYNDEQTLVIENPFIANQYLQHAMARFKENKMVLDRAVDIILVLDQSAVMNSFCLDGKTSKMDAVIGAANLFVDVIEDHGKHKISLVGFDRKIKLFDPLVTLESFTPKKRVALKAQIEKMKATSSDSHSSCYGLPLTEANAQLSGVKSANGRQMVHFLTGSRQGGKPYASEVYSDLSDRGVKIHCTAFGIDSRMDILDRMAVDSGGSYAQVALDDLSLKRRFARVANDAMQFDVLFDKELILDSGRNLEQLFCVDPSAENLKFIVAWPVKTKESVQVNLMAPDGTRITDKLPGVAVKKSSEHMVISVSSAKKQKFDTAGQWKMTLKSDAAISSGAQRAAVMVLADTQMDFDTQVIAGKHPNTVLVLARLLSDGKPVINGQHGALELKTFVGTPLLDDKTSRKETLVLMYDDGRHGDGKAGDGLFGMVLGLPQKGEYTFRMVSYFSQQQVPDRKKSMMRQAIAHYSWGLEKQRPKD